MVGVASARGANDFTTQPHGRPFGKSLSCAKPLPIRWTADALGTIGQGIDISVVHDPVGAPPRSASRIASPTRRVSVR
jgi:hypothetical protein